MDIVNFDALKAQDRIIDPSQVDPEEDYFIIGKYTNHYTTNSMKYTKYPVYAIKAGDVMGTQPTYKVYTAILTQKLANTPQVITLENNLSGVIVWSYFNPGMYKGTLTGAFTDNKTAVIISGVALGTARAFRLTDDEILVETRDIVSPNTGLLANSKLDATTIEIRVYN
jgi:hypothetical protein